MNNLEIMIEVRDRWESLANGEKPTIEYCTACKFFRENNCEGCPVKSYKGVECSNTSIPLLNLKINEHRHLDLLSASLECEECRVLMQTIVEEINGLIDTL